MFEVNTEQLYKALTADLSAGLTPMVISSPGMGKSDIIRKIAKDYKLYLIDLRVSQCEPVDMQGFPSINERGRMTFNIPEYFPIEGEDTPLNICDDVYLINGTQTGVSSDDVSYSIIIAESLNVQVCCKWIRGGELDLDIQDFPTITVNFGNDECNSDAVITILNQDIPVEME